MTLGDRRPKVWTLCHVIVAFDTRIIYLSPVITSIIICNSLYATTATSMAIELSPLPLPASADPSKFISFGREVKGIHPGKLTPEEFREIEELLYKHDALLFRNIDLTPEQQYALTKAFDPDREIFGHGDDRNAKSILHYLMAIPRVPQVQLIGNGILYDHEGMAEVKLKHPSHETFHKTRVSQEDANKGITRFNRWHIDAALYDFLPPKVTTLYAVHVPIGPKQVCRYDDDTGDELEVPLATTAFVSGKTMFDLLPKELKSLAVRSKAKYAPHPYIWMSRAKAMPTGLGIESDGLEMTLDELPAWEKSLVKILPFCWVNPVTKNLHMVVHPCVILEVFIDTLPEGTSREGALYPDGAHITDLKSVRELVYKMQRPAIAPNLVYPHDWSPKDLMLFHNRGIMHSVVGALKPDQVRAFHQCNLAASDDPTGPTPEQVRQYA